MISLKFIKVRLVGTVFPCLEVDEKSGAMLPYSLTKPTFHQFAFFYLKETWEEKGYSTYILR